MKLLVKKIIRYSLFPFILLDFIKFWKLKDNRFVFSLKNIYPCIKDKTIKTGFDRHYVYHTSWASRKVREINPEFHIDISSSLYFASIVSAFIPVKFYDYRPANIELSNMESLCGNLMSLPFENNSVRSISCMHVVEHIGLGRYGDKIDSSGDLKAINELKRVLVVNGSLLFVVPMGKISKIEFNAHRIYTFKQIKEYFSDLELREFSLIPEKHGSIIYNATENDVDKERYACGCFWFIKK